jgi:hypothetical protein
MDQRQIDPVDLKPFQAGLDRALQVAAADIASSFAYIAAVSTWRYPDRTALATNRVAAASFSVQVPSPMAGIFAPFAFTQCIDPTSSRLPADL